MALAGDEYDAQISWCAMLQRLLNWFWSLTLVQKVLAVLFGALVLFSVSYLVSTTVFQLMGAGDERADAPSERGAAPGVTHPETTASASSPVPNIEVKITSARWEGEKAVVEGSWRGELSSVHCALWERGASGKATRWWDRSVGPRMDWSGRTFTQEFVAAEEGEGGEPLDPGESYRVLCRGEFADGWSTGGGAQVKGNPPS